MAVAKFTRVVGATAAAIAFFGGGANAATPAPAKPQRIISMNMCTDLLVLQLVPKDRIVSVSYLAHDAVQSIMPGADAGVATNNGTSEDLINQTPDLVITGDFSTAMTRKLAKRVGANVVEVKSASTFEDIHRIVRQVGAAVGEPARAQALLDEMDGKLAHLAATAPSRRITVVSWSGGTSVPGKDTLSNAIIEAAGAVNVAALPGAIYSTFDVEQLLKANPDALLYGASRSGLPSLRSDQGQHRIVRRIYGDRRVAYAEAAYSCGLPQSADAAIDLRRRLQALPIRSAAK